jgi:serine/threonine protein kinase
MAGTFCYIDPEYQKTGMVCTKSDVYALGIIFLQLVTGRGPMGLTYSVMHALEEHNLAGMLDPKVPDWPFDETKRLAELALKCSELRRKDRPDLGSVIWPEMRRLAAFAESKHDSEFFMQHHRCHSLKVRNFELYIVVITQTNNTPNYKSSSVNHYFSWVIAQHFFSFFELKIGSCPHFESLANFVPMFK